MTITGAEWLAVVGGIAGIALVNWWFFLAGRAPATAAAPAAAPGIADAGVQEQVITVDGGYSPAVVQVKAGRRVRLVFDRKDTGGCSEEVVLPDFGVRKFLPTGKLTTIEVTPPAAGTYEFMCGMSMLRGTLIAD